MVTLGLVLGGTAVAASVSGDTKADTKLIKKLAPSLSVKHAATANSATNATNATHATNATNATNAINATNAANATHATSADSATNATNATRAASSATTDQIKTWFATASVGQTPTLLTIGPFTYTGQCTSVSGNPHAQTFVTTSQDGSVADSYADYVASGYPTSSSNVSFGVATGPISIGYGSDENIAQATVGAHWVGPYDGSDTQLSGDGHTFVNTFASVGTVVNGADCTFVGHAVVITH
jgi:hypothetical protein